MTNFVPKPGQTDYTNIHWAPVINCVVLFQGKILLVKRSDNLNLYPGYFNGVSGFLDDDKTLEEKVNEELLEEVSIDKDLIHSIQLGNIFHAPDDLHQKTWIVHPVLVKLLKKPNIKLDWEATDYQWIDPKQVSKLKVVPSFNKVLESIERLL